MAITGVVYYFQTHPYSTSFVGDPCPHGIPGVGSADASGDTQGEPLSSWEVRPFLGLEMDLNEDNHPCLWENQIFSNLLQFAML